MAGIDSGGDGGTSPRFWRLVVVQAAAFALLIVSAAARTWFDVNMGFGVTVCFAVLVVFLIYWPFRGGMADRLISGVVGVLSIAFAVMALDGVGFYPGSTAAGSGRSGIDAAVIFPYAHWASAFVTLLVILTVVGFARQMAREERSHLVRALSHSLTSGVASVSMAGWLFLPGLFDELAHTTAQGPRFAGVLVILGAAVVLILALASESLLWWGQSDPDERVRAPWVGFALLSVLFSGLVVYGAGLGVRLIQG